VSNKLTSDIRIKRNKWGDLERQIVIGLISDGDFAARLVPILQRDHLTSSFARLLMRWCANYYKEYGKVPGKEIQNIFRSKQRDGSIDEADEELIETFLDDVIRDYNGNTKHNTDYLIDRTFKYIKRQTLQLLSEDIQTYLSQGQEDAAENLVNEYYRIEDSVSDIVDPLKPEIIKQAYAASPTPIVEYPGVYGSLINPVLTRSSLVAFMGIEKRGKSWVLLELAMRAARQRRSVAFFQVGDMDQAQQVQRIGTYLTRAPHMTYLAGKILVPCLDCLHNQTDQCKSKKRKCATGVMLDENVGLKVDYDEAVQDGYSPCTACRRDKNSQYVGAHWKVEKEVEAHTEQDVIEAAERFKKNFGKSKLLLESQPAGTVTLSHIQSVLKAQERIHGFVPDVIVIDYADILMAEKERDFRHKQNELWTGLRALSQEYHALVVTATQADAAAYEKETISIKNFSEDKRKLAHVTAALSLNQTDQEKKEGVLRIAMLLARGIPFSAEYQVRVLQSLTIGQPFLGSY